MQRAALLDAARSLLSEGGTEALTFPALAERTGLARSSVYEYFRSRAAVVEELCEVDFPVWAAEVSAAMAAADGPEGKVEAYVRQQLALVGDRRHRAVVAISASELDAGAREKTVVTLYYYEGLTLAEIGNVLGVTESRVSQIHTKSVLQLRAKLASFGR